MSDENENSSGFGQNVSIVVIVLATAALSLTFLMMSGGFTRQQLWSDANAAELTALDRADPGQSAAAPTAVDQQGGKNREPALELRPE